ncbi:hypothetical protein GBAR_LOCUS28526, partial [Geodia barretti]
PSAESWGPGRHLHLEPWLLRDQQDQTVVTHSTRNGRGRPSRRVSRAAAVRPPQRATHWHQNRRRSLRQRGGGGRAWSHLRLQKNPLPVNTAICYSTLPDPVYSLLPSAVPHSTPVKENSLCSVIIRRQHHLE